MNARRTRWLRGLILSTALVAFTGCKPAMSDKVTASIKEDEEVIFFPTCGFLSSSGEEWSLPVHGWVFEPEEDSALRRATLSVLRRTLGLEKGEAETDLFVKRARAFLTDNERAKRVSIRLGEEVVGLRPSGRNGHFRDVVPLAAAAARRLSALEGEPPGWVRYDAVLKDGDERRFTGRVQLLSATGLSVVSDIDDTIKVTEVTDHEALVRNTFLREYEVVPGMAQLYRRLASRGASFHYLSNSPWQLYRPLSDFLEAQGFPRGSYHLRPFRLKDRSFLKFISSQEEHKRAALSAFFERFKERTFLLVGDCGEKDPEIYGDFARRYPDRVERILLRDPSGRGSVTPRLEEAMRDIPTERWQVFTQASEVEESRQSRVDSRE